ncbi:MAG: Coenzyme F420 hydrogenase/dehydrogenase, beta subunit C-terminal domain [Chloroflexi bacterium]|nr:Coenzyme F420 hydrogenase/dehydrogenase, beta subunit C-terminal domain [Chloroflexota bacterium]
MDFQDLHRDVIGRGLCTVCGMCAGVCPTKGVVFRFVDHEPEPVLEGRCTACGLCYEACPGRDIPLPQLDQMVFGRQRDPRTELLGIYRTCLAGQATDPAVRQVAAAGGVVSALLLYALDRGLIARATVGEMDPAEPWRARPAIATDREAVLRAAQTKQQAIPTNASLLPALSGRGGRRVACVGVGCHHHGLRLLQLRQPKHRASQGVAFQIGLFCYSNYYTRATELLILERMGLESLDEIAHVEYRHGQPHGNFYVVARDGRDMSLPGGESTSAFFMRFFCRDRCLMCYDWTSELADVSVGDYWGPALEGEDMHQGWCTLLVRTPRGEELVQGAEAAGCLRTHPADPYYLTLTGGYYRHKHAAVHNIMKRRRYGWPTPDFGYPLVLEPIPRKVSFDNNRLPHLGWLHH